MAITVLLAEDDPAVRRLMIRLLQRAGYAVLESRDGAEALAICRSDAVIDLVIADGQMPELDGPGLVRALAGVRPGLRVLLCSGAGRVEGLPFLAKPFTAVGLLQAVASTLEAKPSTP